MPSYEIISTDPIEKLMQEIENLKNDLKALKSELKNNIEEIKSQISLPIENNFVKKEVQNNHAQGNIDVNFYKEIVNSLIRSNIDLQAKISELVVVSNNLYREIKNLFEIFKEAALTRQRGPREEKELNEEFVKRLENLEKANLKVAEMLDNLKRQLEDLKNQQNNLNKYINYQSQTYSRNYGINKI
jgi:predicted nuclease with TOPRIM domain